MAKVASPAGGMDAEFLVRTVGDPLSEALTSLVIEQPADPIEFIGEALLDYVKRREEEDERNRKAAEVEHLFEQFRVEQDEAKKAEISEKEEAATKAKAERDVETAILQADSHEKVYSQVLGLLEERIDISGVQLGRKVVVDGQEIVEFIAASESRQDMLGQELKGLRDGEEGGEEDTEEGVTFDVWKKTEVPPPPEPVYDEDGELVPDESEPELIPPKHILIENIVRDPRVKVFGTPKLGAYLAVPMTYDTWLQPGGILMGAVDLQPTDEEGEENQDETEVVAEGGGEEVAADVVEGGEVEGAGPEPPTNPYRKFTGPVHLVLCMDTLGKGRCFRPKEIEWVKDWAAKIIAGVEALEVRMFEEESALLPKLRGDEVMESLSEVTSPEAEEAAIAEALAAVDAGSDEKEQATMSARYRQKVKAVEVVAELVSTMGMLNVAPGPTDSLTVLEHALLLVGKARADICDSRGSIDWRNKMRELVGPELVSAIVAFDPEDPAAAPRAEQAKEAIEAVDPETIKNTNAPTWAILGWMSSAIVACEVAAVAAAAAAEAAAAARAAATAEEEGDEGGEDA